MNREPSNVGRRDLLRLGSVAAIGSVLAARPSSAAPRSSIVIWQEGGCSHLDTFDMKPSAPREIRGEFRPISTTAPGIEICEHLPRTAKLAHKFAIVRSMTSRETNHERARHYLETGMPLSPGKTWPRFTAAARAMDDAYGHAPLGRQCLRARHEVQAGAPLVLVRHRDYDTHRANFERLRVQLLPEFDQAFSALIEDLDRSALLDTTLVVVMGEFGRSPRINEHGGRDHHSGAWSVLLAGAGVRGGTVVGATDETGTSVIESPVAPEDLLATIANIVPTYPVHLAKGRAVREVLA